MGTRGGKDRIVRLLAPRACCVRSSLRPLRETWTSHGGKGATIGMSISAVLGGVQPSLGCTEPGAIALACALARRAVGGDVKAVSVRCDPNVFKNALGVGVPGAGGRRGIPVAAALGALAGDPALRLKVLAGIGSGDLQSANELIADGRVECMVDRAQTGIHVEATVRTSEGTGRAVIDRTHLGVTAITADNEPVGLPVWVTRRERERAVGNSALEGSLHDALLLAENLTPSDKDFLLEGMRMNQAAGRAGIVDSPGLGYGASVIRLIEQGDLADDAAGRAMAVAGAAVDARMSGLPVPVMASGDSGNQGIVATVPVAELGRRLGTDDDRLARALATCHLVVAYIKHRTGSLSAVCGAYAAAAPGAAAGVISLLGGDESAMVRAIGMIVGNVSGVICDGAKAGCAVKVGTAAGLAVRTAYQAMQGVEIPGGDGVVADTPEESVTNLARVVQAMKATDATILDIATSSVNHSMAAD